MKKNILIVTIKEWNIANYYKLKEELSDKFEFNLISDNKNFNLKAVKEINPEFIFFPHWSWIISEDIYSNYNCIVFHMTDLPFGRGGSPFQNLIIRGIYNTKISALKVEHELDAGHIYFKENFDISIGSADENFYNLSFLVFNKMIPRILLNEIEPYEQNGEVTKFNRRKPSDSNLLEASDFELRKLYDFIRMLDGEGYPKAYFELGRSRIELSEVNLKNNKLTGRFEIYEKK